MHEMSPLPLIEQLKVQGIRLELQGGSLRVHAAKGALTPEIRELLRTHSADLARELRDSVRLRQGDSAKVTSPKGFGGSEGEALTVEQLADLIRGQLEGRPLPIAISPAESIVDVELFARGEARAVVSGCPLAAEAARVRLRGLGIVDRGLEG